MSVRQIGDSIAATGVVATLVGLLPAIAALLSVVWFALQITEKLTGKTIPVLLKNLWKYLRP